MKEFTSSRASGARVIFIILASIFILFSCRKAMPAGFWGAFQKEYLKENISDQGPWGGHRAMHWQAKEGVFKPNNIIDFATDNGWQLIDSLAYNKNTLKTWNYLGSPIFPLSNIGFTPNLANFGTYEDFPRWINSDLKVYQFKSGWIAIEPGTDNATNINGFVVLKIDGSEMSVYHIWGE